jgi:glycosyltransferase involved in cell wall biosynthesis
VVTFHGSDVFGLGRKSGARLKSAVLRAVSRFVVQLASGVIAVSPEIKRELHRKDAHVIPMGIDRKLFRPLAHDDARARLAWPLDERTVLFVGSPKNPIKRFDLAQDAVTLAAGTFEFPLALRVCENEAPETVPIFMNAADVLLITSRHEGGPLVLREALACNLPVVSSDVGDARTRLARVPGCILAASNKPETIAAALVSVLKDSKRVDGSAGIADLDEDAITGELVEIYQSVCGRGPYGRWPKSKPAAGY